jgi:hypothetical protein
MRDGQGWELKLKASRIQPDQRFVWRLAVTMLSGFVRRPLLG